MQQETLCWDPTLRSGTQSQLLRCQKLAEAMSTEQTDPQMRRPKTKRQTATLKKGRARAMSTKQTCRREKCDMTSRNKRKRRRTHRCVDVVWNCRFCQKICHRETGGNQIREQSAVRIGRDHGGSIQILRHGQGLDSGKQAHRCRHVQD